MFASVSTLETSVGAPPTPRSNGRGGVDVGSRGAAVQERRRAPTPRPRRTGRGCTIGRSFTPAVDAGAPPARRSRARRRPGRRGRPRSRPRSRRPRARRGRPRRGRGAARSASRTLSLPLGGSPSAPFATTIARPRPPATASSLRAVGKPAPPRPRRPAAPTSVDERCGRRGAAQRRARCRGGGGARRASVGRPSGRRPASRRGTPAGALGRVRRGSAAVWLIRAPRCRASSRRRCRGRGRS